MGEKQTGYINETKKKNFDDSKVREFVIWWFKTFYDIEFINGEEYGVDLVSKYNKPGTNYKIYIELEHGTWKGDLWTNLYYELLSQLGYPTVNIPLRKLHLWFDGLKKSKPDLYYVLDMIANGKLTPNNNETYFIRTNKDFTQMILIRPSVIKNLKNFVFNEFSTKTGSHPEPFLCFPKNVVETKDEKSGIWTLQSI